MYIIGVDGGGTKTEMAVFDELGHILYHKIGPGLIDYLSAMRYEKILKDLFDDVKRHLKITSSDIELVVLGLSGADTKDDFDELNQTCKHIFNDISFQVINDAWIIMRSGLKTLYGAVAIAGTGTNAAAIKSANEKAILRSLSYMTGTFGGGLDIARESLYYAFRSNELTYKKTMLEIRIARLFGYDKIEDLLPMLYPKNVMKKDDYAKITALTFACAKERDEVAIKILRHAGTICGEQTAGVIKQLNMQHHEIPVVMGGRVFSDETSDFNDSFKEALLKEAPKATFIKSHYRPVAGAYLWALDLLNIKQTKEIELNLDKGMNI